MWDKHRQARKDSRKRAMRAAQDRAARRLGAETEDAAPEPASEPSGQPTEHYETAPEPDDAPEDDAPVLEPAPIDAAGSLAWTGLVLLTLVLGGFMAALLFMLG